MIDFICILQTCISLLGIYVVIDNGLEISLVSTDPLGIQFETKAITSGYN